MAISAGTITAEALLDISQVNTATNQLAQEITRVNQLFGSIKVPEPRLQADKLTQDLTQVKGALGGVVTELGQVSGLAPQATQTLLGIGGATAGVAALGAAVTGLIAGLAAAAKVAADLQFQVAAVKSIKLDLDTTAATASLRQLAAETGQSADSLAKGLYNLFSSINVPQQQAIELLRTFAQGAVAAQTDASTFGTAIVGILNAYKLATTDATHVADVFFNTVRDGVVTGQQLAAGLGPITASAKAAGVSLEEMGALIVGVTKEGGDAAQNLNNLNNLLLKLVTKETTQDFKDLGIAVADANGKLAAPIEILDALRRRLEGLSEAQKANVLQQLFPDLQARQAAQVLLNQLDTVREALRTNQEQAGSTSDAYNTMADTAVSATKRFEQSVTALAGQLGDTLLPTLTEVVTALSGFVTGMGKVGEAIDKFLADPRTREAARLIQALGGQPLPGSPAPATGVDPGTGQLKPAEGVPQGPLKVSTAASDADIARIANTTNVIDDLNAMIIANEKETRDATLANALLAESHADLQRSIEAGTSAQEGLTEAQQKAAAAAAAQAQQIELQKTAQERLAAGLAAAIGVQVDWNAELVKALDPVKNLSGVTSGALVEGILKAKEATEESSQVFEIHDKTIAAQVIALRDAAAKSTDLAEALALQKQAGDLAAAALDAQAKSAAAAAASASALAKPLNDLASAVYPALTAQQIANVEAVKATEGPYAAMAEAARQAGIDLGQFGDVTQLTQQQLKLIVDQVGALAKGFAGFLEEEQRARLGGGMTALAEATDSATAAQAKFLAATGQSTEAYRTLLTALGAGGLTDRLVRDLEAGGTAAQDAREQISALTTFVRQNGQLTLKIDVDIQKTEDALGKLQRNFQEGQAERARAEDQAQRQFAVQQVDAQRTRDEVQTDFRNSLREIDAARTASSQQVGRDIATASRAANDATIQTDQAIQAAITQHAAAIRDAQQQYRDAVTSAQQTLTQGLQGVGQQMADIVKQIGEAAAQGLRAQAQAMEAFNDQQRQQANAISIRQQNAALDAFGFTDAQSKESARRLAEIQQQGTDALNQQSQANQLNQTLQSSNQQLQKATEKAADQMNKLNEQVGKLIATYNQQVAQAAKERDTRVKTADDALEKAIRDGAAAQGKTTQQFGAAQEKAIEDNAARQKKLDEQEAAARQKYWDALIKEAEERARDPKQQGRTAAEVQFDEQEAQRRREQAKAERDFQEQKKNLDEQLENLRAIRRAVEKAAGPSVTLGQTNILETSKDMLSKAADVAKARLRV